MDECAPNRAFHPKKGGYPNTTSAPGNTASLPNGRVKVARFFPSGAPRKSPSRNPGGFPGEKVKGASKLRTSRPSDMKRVVTCAHWRSGDKRGVNAGFPRADFLPLPHQKLPDNERSPQPRAYITAAHVARDVLHPTSEKAQAFSTVSVHGFLVGMLSSVNQIHEFIKIQCNR